MTYDANGERTSETTGITSTFAGYGTQYGYDFDGQLTSITKSGSTTTYRYDPLGRQVSRTVNGVLTGFGFDGGQVILEEQNSVTTATYTWGNELIRRNGEFPLTDAGGNVRHMTDANGSYLATTQADPFGVTVASSGSSANPYLYGETSGYRSDGDGPTFAAPLMKVGARYYDPEFGCFLTRDTDLSQSPYVYCNGDPVNFTDPSGHERRHPGWPPSQNPNPDNEYGPGSSGYGAGSGVSSPPPPPTPGTVTVPTASGTVVYSSDNGGTLSYTQGNTVVTGIGVSTGSPTYSVGIGSPVGGGFSVNGSGSFNPSTGVTNGSVGAGYSGGGFTVGVASGGLFTLQYGAGF